MHKVEGQKINSHKYPSPDDFVMTISALLKKPNFCIIHIDKL
jgi:hypothetical protein